MIYQDFFEDDYFGVVEVGLRLLWIGLIAAAADDQGRILDNTALIRAKVFMYDREITDDQIDSWLDKLCIDGKIMRYVADDKRLIQITKWWEYQTPSWANASKYPPPDNWIDRTKYHAKGNEIVMDNWDKDGGLTKDLSNKLHSKQDSPLNDVKLRQDDGDNKDDGDKELIRAFCDITKIPLPSNASTYAKWLTEAHEWIRLGADKNKVEGAIRKANDKGYTVARPHSITNFLRGDIAKQTNADTDDDGLVLLDDGRKITMEQLIKEING
jgi:hypothetical protein